MQPTQRLRDAMSRVPVWESLDQAIRSHAATRPDDWAYIEPAGRLSWAAYDGYVTLIAAALVDAGIEPGERVALWIPDGVLVHAALSAALRAGVVAVGIGARSGEREVRHLLSRTEATTLLTVPSIGQVGTREVFDRVAADLPRLTRYLDLPGIVPAPVGEVRSAGDRDALAGAEQRIAGRRRPVDALSIINSTSGTTGLPKCVAHDERRWLMYHEYSVDCGDLSTEDVCLSVVPAPFGFGLWTAHFTPTLLGAPTVVLPRFDPRATLQLLQDERVTVFMAVSTQFVMMLGQPDFDDYDLSALRVMFTGGEAVPRHKAEEFERRTGAVILNMYGSNESGVLSYTTTDDPPERRHTTAGRLIPEVEVRLFDADRNEIDFGSGPGQPGLIGTVRSRGYYQDDEANRALYTEDGWMLMGDLVTIDAEGYLQVVGRTSDFIIRGGKNISAPAVEELVSEVPGVLRAAAVAVPDEVFGERVCVYVIPAGAPVTLDAVRRHLADQGVSKEWLPEYLVLVEELPVSEGGKLAKGALRADARRRRDDGELVLS
ncbi:acyl--CoA ligase [Nocardioides marmoriginsengisoli]|uniref:Acyl--CoA ligase n=1 Tax=Nocardioides marmoriginsengisoli TaxID=661483 RepID=A0A3N0CGL9_9ACTN|nr:class I adenylate-forming enzyme family protein [Nocardioides marmoriginsengisoli]RNL62459.1 acyl--CoA ligase [Nocardioides marmoriginsengisoli]